MQGRIWHAGYENNESKGIVFDDVPEALEKWHALGIKVAISFSKLCSLLQIANYFPVLFIWKCISVSVSFNCKIFSTNLS